MSGFGETQDKLKLKVNFSDLEDAFDNSSMEIAFYLDKETGEIFMITSDIRSELEEFYEEWYREEDEPETSFEEELKERGLQDWQKEELLRAHLVESDEVDRFVQIPRSDSHEAYQDMESFIGTVKNERLEELLEVAINGRGAFRRFKDVLARYPDERERWFQFQSERIRERILEWLEEEGIEPVLE